MVVVMVVPLLLLLSYLCQPGYLRLSLMPRVVVSRQS